MSFILDALKKSENERQLNAPPEFATVPADLDSQGPPRWLWVLGGLLLVNLIVVGALLTRDATPSHNADASADGITQESGNLRAPVSSPGRPADAFAQKLDTARRNLPARSAAKAPAVDDPPAVEAAGRFETTQVTESAAASSLAVLPSLDELRVTGQIDLPEMHIDIHVWSENAPERFVFINMDKLRENDASSAGPVVREITRDGVVLEHQGLRFVLPRD